MHFLSKGGAIIWTVCWACVAVLFLLFLIIVTYQYNGASFSHETTEKLTLTFREYGRKPVYKSAPEYYIMTDELELPVYFASLTDSYCDINVDALKNAVSGAKFTAYIVDTTQNDTYAYELIEMIFDDGTVVLSMDDYNRGHRQNAVIGYIIVSIMAAMCFALSGYGLHQIITKKYA